MLVNNAGVGVGVPIADMPHDEWDRIIGTNLTGVFNCCKAAIPLLRARGGGWIVNVSSLAEQESVCRRRRVLRVEGGPQRLQRGADAGAALRQHPRHLRAAGFGRDRASRAVTAGSGADWKLLPEDVAQAIVDMHESPGSQPAEPHRDSSIAAKEGMT